MSIFIPPEGGQFFDSNPRGGVIKIRGSQTQGLHSIWNAGSADARVMETFTPAGFEEFMCEVAEMRSKNAMSEERFRELCSQYGVRFFDDWTGDDGWVERTRQKFRLNAT